MEPLNSAIALVIAYLLGSIPFAYLVARLVKGVDIRRVGDGNPGTANVTREIGLGAGVAVLLLDGGKGAVAMAVSRWLAVPEVLTLACGLLAVAGHMFSIFLGFRGGGGAATALGALFFVAPPEFAISFGIMLVSALLTWNFGMSVAIGLAPLPLIMWVTGTDGIHIAFAVVLALCLALRNWRDLPAQLREAHRAGKWKDALINPPPWRDRKRVK